MTRKGIHIGLGYCYTRPSATKIKSVYLIDKKVKIEWGKCYLLILAFYHKAKEGENMQQLTMTEVGQVCGGYRSNEWGMKAGAYAVGVTAVSIVGAAVFCGSVPVVLPVAEISAVIASYGMGYAAANAADDYYGADRYGGGGGSW